LALNSSQDHLSCPEPSWHLVSGESKLPCLPEQGTAGHPPAGKCLPTLTASGVRAAVTFEELLCFT